MRARVFDRCACVCTCAPVGVRACARAQVMGRRMVEAMGDVMLPTAEEVRALVGPWMTRIREHRRAQVSRGGGEFYSDFSI